MADCVQGLVSKSSMASRWEPMLTSQLRNTAEDAGHEAFVIMAECGKRLLVLRLGDLLQRRRGSWCVVHDRELSRAALSKKRTDRASRGSVVVEEAMTELYSCDCYLSMYALSMSKVRLWIGRWLRSIALRRSSRG